MQAQGELNSIIYTYYSDSRKPLSSSRRNEGCIRTPKPGTKVNKKISGPMKIQQYDKKLDKRQFVNPNYTQSYIDFIYYTFYLRIRQFSYRR